MTDSNDLSEYVCDECGVSYEKDEVVEKRRIVGRKQDGTPRYAVVYLCRRCGV